MNKSHSSAGGEVRHPTRHHYRKLLIMTVLSFFAMYALMYAMADRFQNVINNINQVYMAGLMSAAMVLIEMVMMGNMYPDRKVNISIILLGVLALGGFFLLIRNQAGVSDRQFLKSMIPHHAAAILMVEETPLNDPELQRLAQDIVTAQNREIEFMKRKLEELER
jgi:uncharacterized protein (DUF305 family)